MGLLDIELRISDIDVKQVETVWTRLKQLQQQLPDLIIVRFNFSE